MLPKPHRYGKSNLKHTDLRTTWQMRSSKGSISVYEVEATRNWSTSGHITGLVHHYTAAVHIDGVWSAEYDTKAKSEDTWKRTTHSGHYSRRNTKQCKVSINVQADLMSLILLIMHLTDVG